MTRRPRYEAFILTGALAGVVGALALGAFRPGDPSYGRGSTLLYLGLLLALVGGLAGGLLAVGLERRAERGARRRDRRLVR